jgi:hypothetical protein
MAKESREGPGETKRSLGFVLFLHFAEGGEEEFEALSFYSRGEP